MLICISLLAAGCGTTRLAPVEITAEDMCENCRMVVSEKRYAAEFIDREGAVHKFDDMGCMKSYLKERSSSVPVAASFVMDYERRQWVAGPEAFYVRSPEFKTPMAGGIVAFAGRASAEQAARLYKGEMLGYREVFEQ